LVDLWTDWFAADVYGAATKLAHAASSCSVFLQARQVPCDVIAPALIPRRAGVRIKTDRRDAAPLAVLYRAGALTAVHVPTEQEEAARDLLRCREDIRTDRLRARHRLSKFLLRHGRRWTATRAWSKRHLA
jgi:transposase